MDPFELLKADHEKVSQLFKQIEAASGPAKLKGFSQLKDELDLHAHIEEVIFYPALEAARETRDITLEGYEEHRVVKELLAELAAAQSVDDEWNAKLTVLKENVEHHVKEEEGELFDKASDVLTGEEADRLGDQMAAEKTRRGGTVEPVVAATKKSKKPGLIRKIASALGIGASKKPAKKTAKKVAKKPTKKAPKKATKKAVSKASTKAAKKSSQKTSKKTATKRTSKKR